MPCHQMLSLLALSVPNSTILSRLHWISCQRRMIVLSTSFFSHQNKRRVTKAFSPRSPIYQQRLPIPDFLVGIVPCADPVGRQVSAYFFWRYCSGTCPSSNPSLTSPWLTK